MTDLSIPIQVLYAGLAGTVLALIVATIQNRWSLKVFFILTLRLAIGWHFLFEGLHKIHSHYVGPSETNKVFSSEMYFAVAEGPLGPQMRKRLNDVDAQLAARLTPQNVPESLTKLTADERAKLREHGPLTITDDEFATMAPAEVAKDWNDFVARFTEQYKLGEEEKKQLDALSKSAMADYAKWVVGVAPRNSTVKFVSGDTPLTAPQRLEYIKLRQADTKKLEERDRAELGVGYGHEMTAVKDSKALVLTAKTTLVADADAFLKELENETFTEVMTTRLMKQAAPPSKVFATAEAFAAILPPAKVPDAISFDALPEPLRKVWDALNTAYKNDYPDASGPEIDGAYVLMKVRLANWYFDRDEFSGLPKPGFGTVVKKYRDATGKGDQNVKAAHDAVLAALDAKYSDLQKALAVELSPDVKDGPVVTPPTVNKSELTRLDWWTRWGIMAIGALLLLGLFTRLACLAGGAFLVLTYLAHPPFPWLPLPPGTEGNPLFINKNVIEFLALMVILVHPTGRWMGLDAIVHKLVFPSAPDPSAKR